MAKFWTYRYGEDEIMVKNTWFDGCELYINGQMTDKSNGLFEGKLQGKLKNGEEIKATLGGGMTIKCALFVDGKLLNPT